MQLEKLSDDFNLVSSWILAILDYWRFDTKLEESILTTNLS